MDRRQFLKTAGLAVAAGAATPLLSSCQGLNGISKSSIADRYSTDLLVVGGGPSGGVFPCLGVVVVGGDGWRLGSRMDTI